jgi:hypothetical protein
VRGVSIPVVRDALLDQFVNDVGAIRSAKPNGDGCGSECLFYRVTATVRGRFFSGTKGGFGMNGCCHLLVVEQVTHVSSARTTVPAGGQFQCTSERWQPTAEEWKALSAKPACSLRADFRGCYLLLARHWGDSITAKDSLDYPGQWMSSDMTRSYSFSGGFIQQPGGSAEIKPSSSVTRQLCHAVVPPKPASDHVRCRFYRSGPLETHDVAIAQQQAADQGTDAWRVSDMAAVGLQAFREGSKHWDLRDDDFKLKPPMCEAWPPVSYGTGPELQQFGYCTWLSLDDMQKVTVELHRPPYLKPSGHLQEAIWVASTVEADLCDTGPAPR